jgi:hypothetical protein
MAGIHVFNTAGKDVDGRNKSGHDERPKRSLRREAMTAISKRVAPFV